MWAKAFGVEDATDGVGVRVGRGCVNDRAGANSVSIKQGSPCMVPNAHGLPGYSLSSPSHSLPSSKELETRLNLSNQMHSNALRPRNEIGRSLTTTSTHRHPHALAFVSRRRADGEGTRLVSRL